MENLKQKLTMRLPAIVLLAVSLLFWGLYDRYELAGPVLLQAPTLADATRVRGDCTETNGLFVLNVAAADKPAVVQFNLPDAPIYELIRVQGRMRIDSVVRGIHSWRCARFLLTQYDKDKKWLSVEHALAAEQGTENWTWYDKVFEVDPSTVDIHVVLEQRGDTGAAEFDQIRAEPVRLRTSYTWCRLLFAGLWIIMGVFYFRFCRLYSRKLRVLILLNVIAILFGTLMPETWIEDLTAHVKKGLVETIDKTTSAKPSTSTSVQNSIEKKEPVEKMETVGKKITSEDLINQFRAIVGGVHRLGHFALFASLCFLVYLSAALERQHRSYYFKVALDILLFAAVTESLQNLTFDRAPGISDWLTDLYGMLTAFILFLIVESGWWLIARGVKRTPEQSG